ncbi:hypothetical protein [Sphingobacterium lactis]|uniref:YtkA-like n=1 Tax=Sphingobacterium lactis TaxID=797291 RepID=A0A1H6CFY4_9SPHI|nr:hypothetical protein [Sphingobacterium lactis]SEG71919.1 hypothetical protein SAMN05421877_11558 [Sphingobacterium lactis]
MKSTIGILWACAILLVSCTKEKTDYEAEIGKVISDQTEFKEVLSKSLDGYTIRVEALNGTFYSGYNEVRIHIGTTANAGAAKIKKATFFPVLKQGAKYSSCPHQFVLTANQQVHYLKGYAVFTEVSSPENAWELNVQIQVDGKELHLTEPIQVMEQPNKNLNMTAFQGRDGKDYVIALIAPRKPNVAENEITAGIYRHDPSTAERLETNLDPAYYHYTMVKGYTLQLDPRMPEPSMGNHSSPNNKDLVQGDDGLYHGVVNYTMTGNWTLNFILLNKDGKIMKGTKVPTDFTPGVAGAKSELFIDILF